MPWVSCGPIVPEIFHGFSLWFHTEASVKRMKVISIDCFGSMDMLMILIFPIHEHN